MTKVPVLVTTDKRGVFFGYLPAFPDAIAPEIALTDARSCIRWSTEEHGFLGLAATGPGLNCRIGPKSPKLLLAGVTSVAACTFEAAEKWEQAPWSN